MEQVVGQAIIVAISIGECKTSAPVKLCAAWSLAHKLLLIVWRAHFEFPIF